MKEEPLPWFPCYPSKLLGALAGMRPDEGYVYWVVCLRIYETGHACRDTIEALARRTGMNKRRVLDALDLSFRAGRLIREGGDGIMNPFAADVMAKATALRKERATAGREGGLKSAEKRLKKQSPEPSNPSKLPPANQTHLHLQEQLQLEVEGKDSAADAPEHAPPSIPKKISRVKPEPASDWPSDYRDQFWSRYPRKTEKKSALEKLDAIAKGGKVPWLTFCAGLNRFVDKSRGEIEKYIKHPTTWLNRGCWDDVYRPDPPGGEHGETRKSGGIGFGAIAERLRASAHAK